MVVMNHEAGSQSSGSLPQLSLVKDLLFGN